MAITYLHATVIGKKQLTHNVVELELELPGGMDYRAGQFVFFKVGGEHRAYSMVNMPDGTGRLVFCIKLVEGGVGSEFISRLKIGDAVTMNGPFGEFVVDGFDRPLVFVAAGVGVAPFLGVVSQALLRGSSVVTLLFGVRSEEDIFYHEKFASLTSPNFKFIPLLSQPKGEWQGETGRVTDYIKKHNDAFAGAIFYVCGSPGFVSDVRILLLEQGVPARDIHVEIFA